MQKTIKFFISLLVLVVFLTPAISFAQLTPLVPCGTEVYPQGHTISRTNPTTGQVENVDVGNTVSNPCNFDFFMVLINKVVKFILFGLAVPIAAIAFAYAGFLLLTSGGSTERMSKAKSIFTHVLLGFIIALAAWLIVNTILSILAPGRFTWIGFN